MNSATDATNAIGLPDFLVCFAMLDATLLKFLRERSLVFGFELRPV